MTKAFEMNIYDVLSNVIYRREISPAYKRMREKYMSNVDTTIRHELTHV